MLAQTYDIVKMRKGLTLTLVALLPESPEKVVTEGTECGLSEEFRHETMALDFMDLLVFDSSPTTRNISRP